MRNHSAPRPGASVSAGLTTDWRPALLEALMTVVGSLPGVRQVRVHGSAAGPPEHLDFWSDLDVDIHADASAAAGLYRDVSWLVELGPVWAIQHQADSDRATVRVVFADARRLDVTIVRAQSGLAPRGRAVGPALTVPVGCAPDGGGAAWDGFPDPSGDADPVRVLVNEFRFQAVLALTRAARQDMLIATHLSLGLAQKILVLGMLLRDRESGTSHHRHGEGGWNRWAPALSVALNPSRGELISVIQNLAVAFDRAAASWGPIPAVAEEPLTGLLRAALHLP